MMTPSIRQAEEKKDIDELILLYTEFHDFHVAGVPDRLRRPDSYDKARLRTSLREILQRDDAIIFVADLNGKVIGFAEVYLHQDEPNPLAVAHRYGHLQSLIVSAPFRKGGTGRALVVAAQQWAREHGATEMQLETWEFAAGPLYFYENLGYRTLRRLLVVDL